MKPSWTPTWSSKAAAWKGIAHIGAIITLEEQRRGPSPRGPDGGWHSQAGERQERRLVVLLEPLRDRLRDPAGRPHDESLLLALEDAGVQHPGLPHHIPRLHRSRHDLHPDAATS